MTMIMFRPIPVNILFDWAYGYKKGQIYRVHEEVTSYPRPRPNVQALHLLGFFFYTFQVESACRKFEFQVIGY